MNKLFITLRKNFILPIKWKKQRQEEISGIVFPLAEDVLLKRDEIIQEILEAERLEDSKKEDIGKARLKLINWFIGK
jgi:hypothetical protein